MVIPELDRAGLRKFALTTGGLIAVHFGLFLPWLFNFGWQWWAVILGAVLMLWGLILPASLRGFYRLWMRFAFALNKVTSPVIMGAIFYCVLLPTGLIMRALTRRDPMNRTMQKETESYRITSEEDVESDLRNPF